MNLGLGIDTGGTYTDAVLYDFDSDRITGSSKALTTKEDLTAGIGNSLDGLDPDRLRQVRMVSLSTTLATNACVEGKGGRAALVMIGCDMDTVRKYGHEYGLPPVSEIIFIEGGHDHNGNAIKTPDWDVLAAETAMRSAKVDSFAIVQLWGMRNPEFETEAKRLITDTTGLPAVCAHELTGGFDFMRRAATTLLNAQLIPLISQFINAVRCCLDRRSIKAPLAIVRGDGSLMSEDFARGKPVETLLSGPAASVSGGIKLSGRSDCVIADMGGTTSDLALVSGGRAGLTQEGAVVGGWRTGTRSILINTAGLGGDSRIYFDREGRIQAGPVRAAPLSWLAYKYPAVLQDLRSIAHMKKLHTRQSCEFYYLVRNISGSGGAWTAEELRIAGSLESGPKDLLSLSSAAGVSVYEINLKRLERHGIVMRSGLTPTDIMHIRGVFNDWEREAAELGAAITAARQGMSVERLMDETDRIIKEKLYHAIVKMLLENEEEGIFDGIPEEKAEKLLLLGFDTSGGKSGRRFDNHRYITAGYRAKHAIVGIGAPIHIYLPDVAAALGADCIIPENAAVANAIGAITGKTTAEETVKIIPRYMVYGISGYDCHSRERKAFFKDQGKAMEWAKAEAVSLVRRKIRAMGSDEAGIVDEVIIHKNTYGDDSQSRASLLLETEVMARAIGKLQWI